MMHSPILLASVIKSNDFDSMWKYFQFAIAFFVEKLPPPMSKWSSNFAVHNDKEAGGSLVGELFAFLRR